MSGNAYYTGLRRSYNTGTGTWGPVTNPHTFSSVLEVTFSPAGAGTLEEEDTPLTDLRLDYRRAAIEGIVSGSLLFSFQGQVYRDVIGTLFTGPNSAPVASGSVVSAMSEGLITQWAAGTRSLTSRAALTAYGRWPLTALKWRTPGAPVRVNSFQVTDGVNTAISDSAGNLTGAANISGDIDYETGVYQLAFTPAVLPEEARYNVVLVKYLPIDPLLLGLNPVRLPLDGRVPVIQPGNMLVIHDTDSFTLPNPVVAGQTYALPRDLLAYVEIRDANGDRVPTDRFTLDLPNGEITFANPLELSEYDQPLIAEHRIEDMVLCQDAQLSGDIAISGAIVHAYGTDAWISSAMRFGDLQARVTEPFDQVAWTGVWSDLRIGSDATAEFNHLVYPITLTNLGAMSERWRIEFTSTNAFRLIGETVGVVGVGNIGSTYAPINPASISPENPAGAPYFSIPALGWGGGWVAGNQLRFNTLGATAPIWINRTTLQGPAEDPTDDVRLEFRGDSQ